MTTPRDPHLPPPEVCDWLLNQNWSAPIPEACISYSSAPVNGVTGSQLFDHHLALLEIGADGAGQRLFIADDVLQILRDDAEARRARPQAEVAA